jgi:hypothetical protein
VDDIGDSAAPSDPTWEGRRRQVPKPVAMRLPKDAIVDTVESRGDVFDCVDVNEQPSVRQLRALGVSMGNVPAAGDVS